MSKDQFITNVSPERGAIIEMLKYKGMRTAEIANHFGWSRERAYNILNQMNRSELIGRSMDGMQVIWGKYVKPPKPKKREKPCLNGTMKAKLNLSYMESPYRAGSMDAYKIASGART
jgi:hypothetical protein